MNYELKPELSGAILEIIRSGSSIVFDTNTADPETYEYFYNAGFDWAFNVS